MYQKTKANGRSDVKRKFAEKKRFHNNASCTSPVVNSVLSVSDFAVCKKVGNRKMWKWGKGFLPIRCKQQTLSPVAVKISGTTGMCFFVSKNKANGRSAVSGNLPRNELTASAFATTAVSGVLSVFCFAVDAKQ